MLADKNHVKRDTCWGLVELLPELHMERAYEDHELLVENLLMWKVSNICFMIVIRYLNDVPFYSYLESFVKQIN